MGKKRDYFGKITLRTDCDKLIVAILDGKNEVFYKGVANVNKKKEMEQLKEDLRFKGVDI